MMEEKSERSLSPLSKDPLSIGKFIRSKRNEEQNPELNTGSLLHNKQSINRQKSPRSIGINTSKVNLTSIPIITNQNNYQNQVKPITHIKIKSPIVKVEPSAKLGQQQGQSTVIIKNAQQGRRQNRNIANAEIPGIVEFPASYYNDESQDPPETPDLPNRMKINSQIQASVQSPIMMMKKSASKIQDSEPGIIRHHNNSRVFSNSAPKDFGVKTNESFQISSPQLPYIHKIDNNIQGFKRFVNEPTNVSSSSQINQNMNKNYYQIAKKFTTNSSFQSFNSPYLKRRSQPKNNIGQIIKKSFEKSDPQQELKLEPKKSFRISNNNFYTNRMKLPTFKQQARQEFQQQVDLQMPVSKHLNRIQKPVNNQLNKSKINGHLQAKKQKNIMNNSINNVQIQQQNDLQPGTLISNSFVQNTTEVESDNLLIIDLRTSIQKIKQALIEGGQRLAAAFNIPQVFYHPPSSLSTSQQLHTLMLEVFSYIGINPQIVSIKKYINCVVMRDKKLCILWNFNGKIYFGGWKKEQTISEGNKDGVGIQWVPSRYIYYGEFKDNKKEGYGIMKKSNKQIYIGCWKNNQRWGWGRVYDQSGNLHQNGQFIEGCFVYPQKGYGNNDGGKHESREVGV